jgi:hypothetical protein
MAGQMSREDGLFLQRVMWEAVGKEGAPPPLLTRLEFGARAVAERAAREEAARLARPPMPCRCGRGVVVAVHGCAECASEAAAKFLAELMGK